MGIEANVGDIKYYYEMGNTFKVEVLNVQEKTVRETLGEEYTLKVLEIIKTNSIIEKNIYPESGGKFSVWKAKNAGVYGGWYLLDD